MSNLYNDDICRRISYEVLLFLFVLFRSFYVL